MEGSRPGEEAAGQPLLLAGFMHREVSPLFGSGRNSPVLLVLTLFFLHPFCSLLVRDPEGVCPWLALAGARTFSQCCPSLCIFPFRKPVLPHLLLFSASRVAERSTLEFVTGFSLHSSSACQGMSLAAAAAVRARGVRGHTAVTGTAGHQENASLPVDL